MFGRKKARINVTESLTAALEAVNQAIEVFCGFRVVMIGPTEIDGTEDTRTIDTSSGQVLKRHVEITGSFKRRWSGAVRGFDARIEMRNDGTGWCPERLFLNFHAGIDWADNTQCCAHWGWQGDEAHVVRIGVEMGPDEQPNQWRTGRDHTDRRLERVI